LSHCAIRWKVAVSFPDGVIVIALWSTQSVTEMGTRDMTLGGG
jgi:hypothetical protein